MVPFHSIAPWLNKFVMSAVLGIQHFFIILIMLFESNTTGIVHTVTPDDHYYRNTTCHHCHNLQHYLLNATKYFTSNTQLLFLPGLHHLNTDLIIENVHNISLVGNGMIAMAIVQCKFDAGFVFINVTLLKISNMTIGPCGSAYLIRDELLLDINMNAALIVMNCSDVDLYMLQVFALDVQMASLTIMNIKGYSIFNHIKCDGILHLFYNETNTKVNTSWLSIDHYQEIQYNYIDLLYPSITLYVQSTEHSLGLQLSNIRVTRKYMRRIFFYTDNVLSPISIAIIDSWFYNHHGNETLFHFKNSGSAKVLFANCHFINYAREKASVWMDRTFAIFYSCTFRGGIDRQMHKASFLKFVNSILLVEDCQFLNNTNFRLISIIKTKALFSNSIFKNNINAEILSSKNGSITLENVTFSHNIAQNIIKLSKTILQVKKVEVDSNIAENSIISSEASSVITVLSKGIIIFSLNIASNIISLKDNNGMEFIKLSENSKLKIVENYIMCTFFEISSLFYPYCMFQYANNAEQQHKLRNYSITFEDNFFTLTNHCYRNVPLTNCRWLSDSSFRHIHPVDINKKYIKYVTNSGTYNMIPQNTRQKSLCICTLNRESHNCSIDDLGYVYPGQTLSLYMHYKSNTSNSSTVKIIFKSDIDQLYVLPCLISPSETLQFVYSNSCMRVNYTIQYTPNPLCGLLLKHSILHDDYIALFYVRQLPCPPGFIIINIKCDCNPILQQFGIVLSCGINTQTILHPAWSWISVIDHNNSYGYLASLACRYYCQPYPLHTNLTIPDTQCQFNRSGVLCGKCQQDFSTIFASPQCHRCSSIYLLLIVPITIAGLLLVLMLFFLNCTVTDGAINAFILFVNIIGINASVLIQEFTPAYILTSLANLDLGIPTCFYNGMDDYAKMWLQLAFPFYLIFIATLLIITSRYSTTIQRLTARRALSVLATLFLLSYAKILHTVSIVLFSYSTITQLPGEQSTIVWSVDANVPLLGVKFIILFITCLIIFLIQVPFTIILLFSRPLRRFHYINKFKPLLDAYQGPYKDKFDYWIGLQLVVRAVFLGISVLNANISIMVGSIVVAAIFLMTGLMHPFKSTFHNYQELLLLFNLQILYIFVQNHSSMIAINTILSWLWFTSVLL